MQFLVDAQFFKISGNLEMVFSKLAKPELKIRLFLNWPESTCESLITRNLFLVLRHQFPRRLGLNFSHPCTHAVTVSPSVAKC